MKPTTASTVRALFIALAAVSFAPSVASAQAQGTTAIADLSAVWERSSRGDSLSNGEPPMTAWGKERFALALPGRGPTATQTTETNAPELQCDPMGIPATYFRPRPIEIIQLPGRVLMLIEVENFFHVIYTDGRDFPEFSMPTWNGYAIGHYEGDTLVVETTNFRGWKSKEQQRWLDRIGHPFSDQLKVVERFRRVDQDTLSDEITIIDPIAYERPWTATMTFRRRDGVELEEFICSESDNRAFEEFEKQLLDYGKKAPE
jgi:hypothetical protein